MSVVARRVAGYAGRPIVLTETRGKGLTVANQEVTDSVSEWVGNVSEHVYTRAREYAVENDLRGLRRFCLTTLRNLRATDDSARWMLDNFAPRELRDEVDWQEVADDLTTTE